MAEFRDHETAALCAEEAGRFLVGLRAQLHGQVDGRTAGDIGDRRADDLLLARLAKRHPDDAILSEESVDDRTRLGADRVWIIDPVDGTREFGEPGRTDWAVHVALVEGGVPTAAAVALPALEIVCCTLDPPTMTPSTGRPPRMVVSRSRPPAEAMAVAAALDGELVPMGSAGAKAMAVVRGEADVYVHAGGQYEWDSAAPVGVAMAGGFHCSRIDGTPLLYNQATPYLPDLVICRPELAEAVLAAIAAAG